MGSNASTSPELPDELLWLKDTPLFIDRDQVARFYDAVVRPSSEEGARTVTVSKQKMGQITGKLGLGGEVTVSELAALLNGFLKPGVTLSGEGGATRSRTKQEAESVIFNPIKTPQRQLEQLAVHYTVSCT